MTDFVNLLDPEYMLSFNERQQGPVDAVPTPFPGWNQSCGDDGGGQGLARKWFVTIGGNPKQGKSLLALALTLAALKAGERCGFMSLEMSDPQLAGRFYAMVGKVSIKSLERGPRYKPEKLAEAADALERLQQESSGSPDLFVNEDPIFDLGALLDHMRFLRDECGVRWFIVDYLQLVSMGDDDEAVRVVTTTVKALRKFAVESDAVVIGLSQFKRSTSENYDTSPRVQGVFGGGAIEQVSDQIILLDHSRYEYDANTKLAMTFLMLTNRHGQHGDIPILWDYNNLTPREGMPDEIDRWPKNTAAKRKRR